MDTLRFEGRDVAKYAEYVAPSNLIEGHTYFAVHFLDDDLMIPEMRTLVFIGRDRASGDAGRLYFQDAASYFAGIRFETVADPDEAEFHSVDLITPLVLEFERALDVLLLCSLTRRKLDQAG